LVNQRSSNTGAACAYLQLLCALDEVVGQSLQQALQVHALDALQVDQVVAAREKGRDDQPKEPTETEDPGILPLGVLLRAAFLQRVQLLGGDDAQIRGPFGRVGAVCGCGGRGFARGL
jgi:hypothetical protein